MLLGCPIEIVRSFIVDTLLTKVCIVRFARRNIADPRFKEKKVKDKVSSNSGFSDILIKEMRGGNPITLIPNALMQCAILQ